MAALGGLGAISGSVSGGKGGINPKSGVGDNKAAVSAALKSMIKMSTNVSPMLNFSGFYGGGQSGTSGGLINKVFSDNQKSFTISPVLLTGGVVLVLGGLWIYTR